MKYRDRDFDPANPCLPPEAYAHLWDVLLANPRQAEPTLWQRLRAIFRKVQAALPVLVAAAFLPLADPPEHQLMRQVSTESRIYSLVWVQPLPGKRLPAPPVLPATVENPYSF